MMEETNRKRGRDEIDEEIREKEEEVVAAKRSREEEEQDDEEGEEQGRPKNGSFDDILSLLESEEDEPSNPYLSSFMTTLQQELSSSSCSSSSSSEPTQPAGTEPDGAQLDLPDPLSGVVDAPQPQEVMRYLLEASDDELGIPASPVDPSPLERGGGEGEAEAEALLHQSYLEREGIDHLDFDEKGLPSGVLEREGLSYDGLWEVDDQTANYYDFLNSQLCYDDLKIEI